MSIELESLQWIFLFYFIGLNTGYLTLDVIAVFLLPRYMQGREVGALAEVLSGYELPITMIVPAFNEEKNISHSLLSLLQLNYAQYEIVVVNDGSDDGTLEKLINEFAFAPFPEAYRMRLNSKPVHQVYQSTKYANLRLVDKENGGKADSLNAGINVSRYPLICSMDADSILQRDSLQRAVQPFLEDPKTVVSGGTVRIVNGCQIKDGFVEKAGLPENPLAMVQVLEYLRAFLFGRMGWLPMNALMIVPGAFGMFRKEVVIAVGGYRTDCVGEDMELVVRIHRKMRTERRPYRVAFVPDPICWTSAPEDFKTLRNQRIRWQQGLCESLSHNIGLLFHPRGGAVGWLAYPFMLIFELLGPIIEVTGYLFITIGYFFGVVDQGALLVFFFVAIVFGLLLSISALVLEELSFRIYPKPTHILKLMLMAVVENFGYRQLNSVWRLRGIVRWMLRRKGKWGVMRRTSMDSQ